MEGGGGADHDGGGGRDDESVTSIGSNSYVHHITRSLLPPLPPSPHHASLPPYALCFIVSTPAPACGLLTHPSLPPSLALLLPSRTRYNRPLISKNQYYDQIAALDLNFALDNPLYADKEIHVRYCFASPLPPSFPPPTSVGVRFGWKAACNASRGCEREGG